MDTTTHEPLPRMATVANAAKVFAEAGTTPGAIRAQIDKRHENGLAASGAVVRHGRKILIDVTRYGAWLAGRSAP